MGVHRLLLCALVRTLPAHFVTLLKAKMLHVQALPQCVKQRAFVNQQPFENTATCRTGFQQCHSQQTWHALQSAPHCPQRNQEKQESYQLHDECAAARCPCMASAMQESSAHDLQ